MAPDLAEELRQRGARLVQHGSDPIRPRGSGKISRKAPCRPPLRLAGDRGHEITPMSGRDRARRYEDQTVGRGVLGDDAIERLVVRHQLLIAQRPLHADANTGRFASSIVITGTQS